MIITESSVKIC